MSQAGARHRVGLAGTSWSVWRDVCVRSAGFPAEMVLAICDGQLARAADLTAADPAAYAAVYAAATERLSRGVAGIYADPVFREALTWQNPGLAQRLRDSGVGTSRRSKDRGRELVVASYLQRYCLKNDTIGFFGPVGWAVVAPGAAGLVVVPGEQVIARR
ncbi:MAG TPA: lantibiotic dehydratase, partial [Streptosporangiaceae bacterium]